MNDARLQEIYQRALATREDGGRAGCVPLESIHAIARGEGGESERLETLAHVMSCRACQRELDLLRAIESAGTRSGAAGAPARRSPRILPWRTIVPLAMAASVLLAIFLGRFEEPDRPRGDAGSVSLIAPAETADLPPGAPIRFAWRADPEARRYVLELLSSGGSVVLTRTTSDTVALVDDTAALAPGTEYRWWVRSITAGGQRTSDARRLRIRSQ